MAAAYLPRELRVAPRLDPGLRVGPIAPKTSLLINPFYPKDPHASFGKHVLTPTLALTSMRDVEAETLQPIYRGSYLEPYRNDPPPRRDLLDRRSFLTSTSLIATRGCHNRCGFCYLSTEGLHQPYQMRDVRQVVEEFKADGQPYAVFTDNNLGSRPRYLRELCRALRPLNKIWSAAVSIDVTDDPSLVREMALAGCTGVFVGFESLGDVVSLQAVEPSVASVDSPPAHIGGLAPTGRVDPKKACAVSRAAGTEGCCRR